MNHVSTFHQYACLNMKCHECNERAESGGRGREGGEKQSLRWTVLRSKTEGKKEENKYMFFYWAPTDTVFHFICFSSLTLKNQAAEFSQSTGAAARRQFSFSILTCGRLSGSDYDRLRRPSLPPSLRLPGNKQLSSKCGDQRLLSDKVAEATNVSDNEGMSFAWCKTRGTEKVEGFSDEAAQ